MLHDYEFLFITWLLKDVELCDLSQSNHCVATGISEFTAKSTLFIVRQHMKQNNHASRCKTSALYFDSFFFQSHTKTLFSTMPEERQISIQH